MACPFPHCRQKDGPGVCIPCDGRLRAARLRLCFDRHFDDSVPGIGDRQLSTIRPEERTTPAGRFVAVLDRNLHGKAMLWVDYDAAISMHPVITSNVLERRAQRLATPTPDDNRISYGCINVPAVFFKNVVGPAFKGTNGIVYVLPETRSARESLVFDCVKPGAHALQIRNGLRRGCLVLPRLPQASDPGFTLTVDPDRRSGGSGHLHAMLLAAEVVADIPQFGSCLAWHALAALNVLRARLLRSTVPTDLGPYRTTRDAPPTVARSLPRPPPTWCPRMPPMRAPAIAPGTLALLRS